MVWFFGAAALAGQFPRPDEVRSAFARSDSVLLDRSGELLHEKRVDRKRRQLDWVSLGDVSPALLNAVLAAEDKRFYSHGGVDWRAVGSALWSGGKRGASTVTMQVVGFLDERLKARGKRRGVWQKWSQMQAARALEAEWKKEEILEAYLNLVGFRGELRGIAAASRGLFGKEPHGLDADESAILASLIRAPNATVSQISERACHVRRGLESDLACDSVRARAEGALARPYLIRPRVALAPHVARRLLEGRESGTEVETTLDAGLQRWAQMAMDRALSELKERNARDGALLVVENETGNVLAYLGNSGESSTAPFVDGVRALRQAGSTLKPFLYGLAIERRLLTAASLVDDAPFEVALASGVYRPSNYDNRFRGPVSVRTALASSLNIPAVRTAMVVGIPEFVERLERLGFKGLERPDFYGPSLALGSADVTLWDLAQAYRVLALGGRFSPLRLSPQEPVVRPRRVYSEAAAFVVADILSDRAARSATFGFENPLGTRFWSAVKTGTSKDMRDNWCVGFSKKHTVAVWIGNFSGQPMWNVSGVSGAAPLWLDVMAHLQDGVGLGLTKEPAGIVKKRVDFEGREPARAEYFLAGTERAEARLVDKSLNPRITYPTQGMMLAMDPDIPKDAQVVWLEANMRRADFHWEIDGVFLASAERVAEWKPRQGKHEILLKDSDGKSLDRVEFEVRGAAGSEAADFGEVSAGAD